MWKSFIRNRYPNQFFMRAFSNLYSVPFSILRILERCVNITKAASKKVKTNCCGCGRTQGVKSGNEAERCKHRCEPDPTGHQQHQQPSGDHGDQGQWLNDQ